MYILIVDDEAINREILEFALSPTYKIKFAEDGKSCFEILKQETPALLLLDLGLPDINGLDILKEIKADQSYGNFPVFVLSAYASDDTRQTCLDAGADQYYSKPYDINELREVIKQTLLPS